MASQYLQVVRGVGPGTAGFFLLCQPAVMAAVSPIAGRFSDRIQPRVVASAGMAVTACGIAVLWRMGEDASAAWIISGLAVIGLGFGLFSSPNANAVMSSVRPADYGSASAILGTMRLAGQFFSMTVVSAAMAACRFDSGGEASAAHSFMKASGIVYPILVGMCVAGVPISLLRGKIRRSGGGEAGPA
jgi:MFS family permease